MNKPRISVVHDSALDLRCDIYSFLHCGQCLREKPEDQSPAEWARLNVGITPEGIQVWCARHNCNVDHMKWSTGVKR